jgi:hypothetical protein
VCVCVCEGLFLLVGIQCVCLGVSVAKAPCLGQEGQTP